MASYIVGRDAAKADIVVPAAFPGVSRSHLRITALANRRYLVEDLNSTSGTFRQIDGKWQRLDREELASDDRIRLASLETSVSALLAGRVKASVAATAYTPDARPFDDHNAGAVQAATPPFPPQVPAKPYDVFLSYARDDLEAVRPLVAMIERQGWTVFWDRKIAPGQQWANQIDAALRQARAVIVVWTKASTRSDWVKAEAMAAREMGTLIPVRFDKASIPLPFGLIQTTDFTGHHAESTRQALVEQFLQTVSHLVRQPVTAKPDDSSMQGLARLGESHKLDVPHILFRFDGRIGRKHYWLGWVVTLPLATLLYLLIDNQVTIKMPLELPMQQGIATATAYYFATLYISLAIVNKRLHDIGLSAWWQLLLQPFWFIATIMQPALEHGTPNEKAAAIVTALTLLLLVLGLGLIPGVSRSNRYGPVPT